MMEISPGALAKTIEQMLLRPDLSRAELERCCEEARAHSFAAVSVHGSQALLAYHLLEGSDTKVACVVGFPLGASDADVKRYEAEVAVDHGAHEINMTLNIGRLRDAEHHYLLREMRDVVEAADERPVKVVLEISLLTPQETERACALIVESGARGIITSTGLGNAQTRTEDVRLVREAVGETFAITAAGGINDMAIALTMLEAGATRIATSTGVALVGGPPMDHRSVNDNRRPS